MLWRSMTSSESYIFLAVFAALSAFAALIYLLSPMSCSRTLLPAVRRSGRGYAEFLTRHDYTADTGTVLVIGARRSGIGTSRSHPLVVAFAQVERVRDGDDPLGLMMPCSVHSG